jgi:hypothetical protein
LAEPRVSALSIAARQFPENGTGPLAMAILAQHNFRYISSKQTAILGCILKLKPIKVARPICGKHFRCRRVLGINNRAVLSSVAVYPNPSNDIFHIALEHEDNSLVDIAVVDIQGKAIAHYETGKNISDKKYSFDLRIEDSGVYILIIKTNDAVKQIKLVKE